MPDAVRKGWPGMDPLDELIWHWGMAYRIWAADGIWYARRDGGGGLIESADPERLSLLIADDYFRRARSGSAS
jgi:hypothetical protein